MERRNSPGRRLTVKDSVGSGESSSMIGTRIEANLARAGSVNTPITPMKSTPSNNKIEKLVSRMQCL